MRITTQMLYDSARKSGLPVNQASLLNYIDSDDTSLFEAANKSNKTVSAANTENRKNYEKLGEKADKLTDTSAALMKTGEDNLFTQAKESGDKKKIYASIGNLFENYNNTLKALKKTPDMMNHFYRQMLTEVPEDAKESLAGIGITFEKDGMASIDMDKVKEADLGTLEDLFGSQSDFVGKMNFIAARIADNAQANVRSMSSGYSSDGSLYSGSTGSKYNFWG